MTTRRDALRTLGPNGEKWMKDPDSFTAADLQRFRDSGITVFHPASGTGGPNVYEQTFWFLSGFNGFTAAHTDAFMRIDSADDFARAKATGKIGLILGVQNSEHFRTAADVAQFHALGQRVSQLTYNTRNMLGNGSTERRDEGLSDYGVAIVAKMIGVEHVGIGSDIDLDGYDDMPPEQLKALRASYTASYGFRDKVDIEGIDHPKRMFDLTEGLIRRKYSDADITGILGGNFVRVLSQIWQKAPVTGG